MSINTWMNDDRRKELESAATRYTGLNGREGIKKITHMDRVSYIDFDARYRYGTIYSKTVDLEIREDCNAIYNGCSDEWN